MASPLADAFKKKLELFKEQTLGVAKEVNLSKRIDKLKSNKNDFNQQRQVQNAVVKNTVSTPTSTKSTNKIANNVPGAKALVVGALAEGSPFKKSKGGVKTLSSGKKWTTSGYVPLTSSMFSNMNLKRKSQSLKKKV